MTSKQSFSDRGELNLHSKETYKTHGVSLVPKKSVIEVLLLEHQANKYGT